MWSFIEHKTVFTQNSATNCIGSPVIFSAFLELLLVQFYFLYFTFLSTFFIYSFYHHSIQTFSVLFHEFDMLFSSFCFHFIKNVSLFGLVSSWRFVFGVVYTIVSTPGQKRKFNCIQAIVSGSLDCARSHWWLQCQGCPTRVNKISLGTELFRQYPSHITKTPNWIILR
jgi:hypothetical protein